MTDRPEYAPGCFGSAHFFRKEDAVCSGCPFANACEPAHQRALEQFRKFYGVKTPKRRATKLPVKVQKIFDQQGKSEEEVRAAMIQGLNPYSVKDSFIGVICHLILELKEVTRDKLERVLAAHKNYNAETASVYTRHSLQILAHCGAITVEGKKVKLERG